MRLYFLTQKNSTVTWHRHAHWCIYHSEWWSKRLESETCAFFGQYFGSISHIIPKVPRKLKIADSLTSNVLLCVMLCLYFYVFLEARIVDLRLRSQTSGFSCSDNSVLQTNGPRRWVLVCEELIVPFHVSLLCPCFILVKATCSLKGWI